MQVDKAMVNFSLIRGSLLYVTFPSRYSRASWLHVYAGLVFSFSKIEAILVKAHSAHCPSSLSVLFQFPMPVAHSMKSWHLKHSPEHVMLLTLELLKIASILKRRAVMRLAPNDELTEAWLKNPCSPLGISRKVDHSRRLNYLVALILLNPKLAAGRPVTQSDLWLLIVGMITTIAKPNCKDFWCIPQYSINLLRTSNALTHPSLAHYEFIRAAEMMRHISVIFEVEQWRALCDLFSELKMLEARPKQHADVQLISVRR